MSFFSSNKKILKDNCYNENKDKAIYNIHTIKYNSAGKVKSLKEFYEDLSRYLEDKAFNRNSIKYVLNPSVKQLVKIFDNK